LKADLIARKKEAERLLDERKKLKARLDDLDKKEQQSEGKEMEKVPEEPDLDRNVIITPEDEDATHSIKQKQSIADE